MWATPREPLQLFVRVGFSDGAKVQQQKIDFACILLLSSERVNLPGSSAARGSKVHVEV